MCNKSILGYGPEMKTCDVEVFAFAVHCAEASDQWGNEAQEE